MFKTSRSLREGRPLRLWYQFKRGGIPSFDPGIDAIKGRCPTGNSHLDSRSRLRYTITPLNMLSEMSLTDDSILLLDILEPGTDTFTRGDI